MTNRHDTNSGFVVDITPVPKPRMTRRDKWAKRDCVVRYFAFSQELNLKMPKDIDLNGYTLTFGIPMPKSWSKKKKAAHDGKPHKQRGDLDNYCKALLDALYLEDCHIHDVALKKVWARNGFILFEIDK